MSSSFFDLAVAEGPDRPKEGLSKPFLSWGDSVAEVKEHMADHELVYSDNTMLVYDGMKSEHLVSYEFEDGGLVTAAMYIEEDMSTLDEIQALFEGYDVMKEYDGTSGEYTASWEKAYAEICKLEKSGVSYWFAGWSRYDVY